MLIVIDQYIPFLKETVQREWPDVTIWSMKPEEITWSHVRNADVLVVRTRTRVNEALLHDTNVKLVCTATIGFDHIDTEYCDAKGIRWMACPGCNAQAVCDYIEEALNEISNHKFEIINHKSSTLGIIGVGNVGSRVASLAHRRGYSLLLNDPAKGLTDPLDAIAAQCDIITFHVPLDDTTYHMCNETFLKQCKPGAWIINAARGGVVDEQALLRSGHPYILDTWENEPHIDKDVLAQARLASMHIAGYSLQGKITATQMCLKAIADQYGLPSIRHYNIPVGQGDTDPGWLARITEQLKAHPEDFEQLRKNYPLR